MAISNVTDMDKVSRTVKISIRKIEIVVDSANVGPFLTNLEPRNRKMLGAKPLSSG
jgi:hypothetical protein